MNILKWKGLEVDPMKISESVTTKVDIGQVDTAFNESTSESGITVLYPRIEAIHEGRTRNFNRYTAEKLKGDHELRSGVYSWTAPYPKPVIYNHDTNTEATGRVYSASYSDYTSAGRPGIIVTPKITQEKAIKDIMEGRLLTVSIGASTNAAVCSLCGTDIINEGYCGHMRGEEYDGQVVEWIAGDLFFDELSWVNVPADSDAMIINTNLTQNTAGVGESKTAINVGDGVLRTGSESIPVSNVVVNTINAGSPSTNSTDKIIVDGSITSSHISANESTSDSVAAAVNLTAEATEMTDSSITTTSTLTTEDLVVTSDSDTNEKEVTNMENEHQAATVEEENTNVEETEEATNVEETTETAVEEDHQESTTEEVAQTDSNETDETEQETVDAETLAQVQDELAEAQNTISELTEANLQLAKELQEATVNFLVDLRLAMGKESTKEEAVQKYAPRTMESLRDSIADILSEKVTLKTARTVETVTKPEGEKVVTESKTLATDTVKVTNNEDVLYKLFNGQTK